LKKIALLILFCCGITISGWCLEPLNITGDQKKGLLGQQSEFFLDPSGSLSIVDLISNESKYPFLVSLSKNFRLGMSRDVLWLRFKIDRHNTPLVLVVDKPFPYVDLYLPGTGQSKTGYGVIKSGYSRYFFNCDIEYLYPVFKLPDTLPVDQYLYLRIQPFTNTHYTSVNFSVFVQDETQFVKRTWLEITFYLFIIGGVWSILFFNLFLAIVLKDKVYYFYLGYVTFILIYISLKSSVNSLIGFPGLSAFMIPSIAITYAFGIAFARIFLNSRAHCPRLDKILIGMIALSFLVLILMVSGFPVFGNMLMHGIGLFGPIPVIIVAILRLGQGYLPARYFLISYVLVFLGTIIIALLGLGVFPMNFLTINALGIGFFFEVILLSMALGDRISLLKKEKKALQKQERRLTELSIKDELTGLFNKRWFSEKIRSEVALSQQLSFPLSLMVIDVDHFKRFNDTHGHTMGDRVLHQLGKIITLNVREKDIPCRYGGEEFCVILPSTDMDQAVRVAERLRQNFADFIFITDSGEKTNATISIGLAEFKKNDDEKSLFDKADKALYQAKHSGRNRVISFC